MNKEELEKVEQLIEQKNPKNWKDCSPAYILPTLPNRAMNWMPEARFIYLLLDNETAADVPHQEMDEDARKDFLEILPSKQLPNDLRLHGLGWRRWHHPWNGRRQTGRSPFSHIEDI